MLPTPEHYIGADKIFGNGDADQWDEDNMPNRVEGPYGSAIIPIENDEQQSFFVFKHKKELADELFDLPPSMHEAIRYFVLASAISDYRKDNQEHRSMLVNVSRFTKVQNRTADLVEEYVSGIKSDLENYSQLPFDQAMRIRSIFSLSKTWEKFQLSTIAGISWEQVLKDYLFKAARRIEVRSVNQQHGASSLNYYEYKDVGMRVIAVGGNSLSRGLTLEGLCVSYFYRNTMMYDTLLQMGRWFGYRPNYDDLFKVWMGEDSVDWYGYITDAVNELKDELRKMKRQNQTPEDFGLKVRQAPGALLITARNKMRTATPISQPITVSGRMLETPRLRGDKETLADNERLCRDFLQSLEADPEIKPMEDEKKAFIWRDVPKRYFHLNEKAERVYVTTAGGEKKRYYVEPVALIFHEDNYYLMAYSSRHPKATANYRLDRMSNVEAVEESVLSEEALAFIDSAAEFTGQAFKMFAGEPVDVVLQFSKDLVEPVFDKFGEDTPMMEVNETTCAATVHVQISPTFFGWLAQFGEKMHILSPSKVVSQFETHIKTILG